MILEARMVKRPALVEAIEADFKERLPDYHKSRREGLAALAGVPVTRSARSGDSARNRTMIPMLSVTPAGGKLDRRQAALAWAK